MSTITYSSLADIAPGFSMVERQLVLTVQEFIVLRHSRDSCCYYIYSFIVLKLLLSVQRTQILTFQTKAMH